MRILLYQRFGRLFACFVLFRSILAISYFSCKRESSRAGTGGEILDMEKLPAWLAVGLLVTRRAIP